MFLGLLICTVIVIIITPQWQWKSSQLLTRLLLKPPHPKGGPGTSAFKNSKEQEKIKCWIPLLICALSSVFFPLGSLTFSCFFWPSRAACLVWPERSLGHISNPCLLPVPGTACREGKSSQREGDRPWLAVLKPWPQHPSQSHFHSRAERVPRKKPCTINQARGQMYFRKKLKNP